MDSTLQTRLVLFLGGPLLLLGRFPWDKFFWRGYITHLFFYGLVVLILIATKLKRPVILFIALFLAFPDHWLGLRAFYPAGSWYGLTWPGVPTTNYLDWLPGNIFNVGLALPFIAIAATFLIHPLARKWDFKTKVTLQGILILMVLQTAMHLSMRSPYSYLPHFEAPLEKPHWYHGYLMQGTGAVNADYTWFREAEGVIVGIGAVWKVFLGRMFHAYLFGQFTRLFPPFFTGVVFNLFVWAGALFTLFWLVKRIFDERTALFATFLLATSQALLVYVGQPKPYVLGLCFPIFVVGSLWVISERGWSRLNACAFAAVVLLWSLTYESWCWFPTLYAVARLKGSSRTWILCALMEAILLNLLFVQIGKRLPELQYQSTLQAGYGDPVGNFLSLLTHPLELFETVKRFVIGVGSQGLHAFLPLLLPLFVGLGFLRRSPELKWVAWLLLPGLLNYALVEFLKQDLYTQYPRIIYWSYLGVTIAGAFALARLPVWLSLAYCTLVLVYVNLDAFGYPYIYFFWFYRYPPPHIGSFPLFRWEPA